MVHKTFPEKLNYVSGKQFIHHKKNHSNFAWETVVNLSDDVSFRLENGFGEFFASIEKIFVYFFGGNEESEYFCGAKKGGGKRAQGLDQSQRIPPF